MIKVGSAEFLYYMELDAADTRQKNFNRFLNILAPKVSCGRVSLSQPEFYALVEGYGISETELQEARKILNF